MVTGVSSVGALEGQIRQAKTQLNDWTTCVSARTTKGQSAIQKLSGEISADKEQIERALQTPATTAVAASGPHSLDVWA